MKVLLLNIVENIMANTEIAYVEQVILLTQSVKSQLLHRRQRVALCGKGLPSTFAYCFLLT